VNCVSAFCHMEQNWEHQVCKSKIIFSTEGYYSNSKVRIPVLSILLLWWMKWTLLDEDELMCTENKNWNESCQYGNGWGWWMKRGCYRKHLWKDTYQMLFMLFAKCISLMEWLSVPVFVVGGLGSVHIFIWRSMFAIRTHLQSCTIRVEIKA
jgi:hypothetical protein